jgi:hypothetical protein
MSYQKTIFALVALTISAFSLFAQSKSSTPEERAQRWDDWMKKELQITSNQETNIHAINLKYAQLNEQLKTTGQSRRSKFQEVKSNENEKEKEMKEVLTKEQFKLYQQKKKDMQRQMLQSRRN